MIVIKIYLESAWYKLFEYKLIYLLVSRHYGSKVIEPQSAEND